MWLSTQDIKWFFRQRFTTPYTCARGKAIGWYVSSPHHHYCITRSGIWQKIFKSSTKSDHPSLGTVHETFKWIAGFFISATPSIKCYDYAFVLNVHVWTTYTGLEVEAKVAYYQSPSTRMKNAWAKVAVALHTQVYVLSRGQGEKTSIHNLAKTIPYFMVAN